MRGVVLKRRNMKKKNSKRFAEWKIIHIFAEKKIKIMTDKEFREFLKSSAKEVEAREANLTTMLETQGAVLDTQFLNAYESEVRYRMRIVRKCLAHYRGLMRDDWLMRLFLLRRVIRLGRWHRELLGRLMLIGVYKKLYHPDPRLFD